MGLTGSRDDFSAGASEAYHAYGRAATRPPPPLSANRHRETDPPNAAASMGAGAGPSGVAGDDASDSSDDDRLVGSLFTWNFGGQSVSVTGAWDGWRQKTPMHRNGTEYSVVIFIPCGEYQFKYFVDDNWQCNPALEQQTDEHGNTNNYVKVVATKPDFDTSEPANKAEPPSPPSSYNNEMRTEFTNEMPQLPAQIAPYLTREEHGHRPDPRRPVSYVRYDHLFTSHADDNVRTLSLMERHNDKTITTLFVTNAEAVEPPSLPPSVAEVAPTHA